MTRVNCTSIHKSVDYLRYDTVSEPPPEALLTQIKSVFNVVRVFVYDPTTAFDFYIPKPCGNQRLFGNERAVGQLSMMLILKIGSSVTD